MQVIDFFGNLFCQYFFLYKNVNFDSQNKVEMDSYKHFYKCFQNLEKLVNQGYDLDKIGTQLIHNREFGLSWPIIKKLDYFEKQDFNTNDLALRLQLFKNNKYFYNGHSVNYTGFKEIYCDLLIGFETKIQTKSVELQQIIDLCEGIKKNTEKQFTPAKIIRRSILESEVKPLEFYLKNPELASKIIIALSPFTKNKPISHFYFVLEIIHELDLFNENWIHIQGTKKSEVIFLNKIFGTNIKESTVQMIIQSIGKGNSDIEKSRKIYKVAITKILPKN